jgi:hypothetical protein
MQGEGERMRTVLRIVFGIGGNGKRIGRLNAAYVCEIGEGMTCRHGLVLATVGLHES